MHEMYCTKILPGTLWKELTEFLYFNENVNEKVQHI